MTRRSLLSSPRAPVTQGGNLIYIGSALIRDKCLKHEGQIGRRTHCDPAHALIN